MLGWILLGLATVAVGVIIISGMVTKARIKEKMKEKELGIYFIGTTLVGYTQESRELKIENNDFELIRKLLKEAKHKVIAEGNINTPEKVRRVMDLGVYSVVVGSAITRPQLITRTFVEALEA